MYFCIQKSNMCFNLVFCLLLTGVWNFNCVSASFEYGPVQFYKSVSLPDVLLSTNAISLIHCATLCVSTPGCMSFDFECQALLHDKEKGLCNILSNSISLVNELVTSDQCFAQKKTGTVTLPLLLPPTTTISATASPTTAMPPTTTSTTAIPPTTTSTAAIPPTTTSTTAIPPTTTSTAAIPPTTTSTTAIPPTTTTTATPATTTTTATISTSTPSVDIIGLLHEYREIFAETSSSYKLFTSAGVYLYDDFVDLFTPGHSVYGPFSLGVMYMGYFSPPAITAVSCILSYYSQSKIEMYLDDDQVYSLEMNRTNVDSIAYYSNSSVVGLGNIAWCVYRQFSDEARFFGLPTNRMYYAGSEFNQELPINESIIESDSSDVNIFKGLTDDVVAVANRHNDYDNAFVVIFANHSVYDYQVTNADTYQFTYRGTLNLP